MKETENIDYVRAINPKSKWLINNKVYEVHWRNPRSSIIHVRCEDGKIRRFSMKNFTNNISSLTKTEFNCNPNEDIKYYITKDQLESIGYFKRMFEYNAGKIESLCYLEKHDIVYGFELGKIHSHFRDLVSEIMEFEGEIEKQKI